ncbi:hypothetical protein BKA56DRAFT_615442 [Ilyonectria sp. MPI-CAGE-AT-0026]|nr:hypothetical protein BKA56DRAFT_615442 [Ilyonectria sp. MPI-CAGE-AT-0026]
MSYGIAAPDEYLAIAGTGINDINIKPFQRFIRFSTQPCVFSMNLQVMTKEKIQFSIPVVFTVGPKVHQRSGADPRHNDIPDHDHEDRSDSFMKYATLLSGIIEGETRVLVSGMTMEEILTEREGFKKRLCCDIQRELSQFALRIFHASVEEPHGVPGMERVLVEVNLSGPSPSQIQPKETALQSRLGLEGPLVSAGTWEDVPSVGLQLLALADSAIKLAEAATRMRAFNEEMRIKRYTGLKPERQASEEQLGYDCKYLDLVYLLNSNLTDVDGHVRSRGGCVDDVVKAMFEEDGLHHHDGRRPPARSAHGHGQGSSRLVPLAQRPLAGLSKGNGHRLSPLPAKLMSGLCIMWGLGVPVALAHRIPDWLLHIVGGTTVAASACVPALQPAEDEIKAYRTGAYIAWAVTFAIFITMELYQRQDQRRLLLGLVVFCGANLLGSLAENSSTTIDTITNWGPLALSLSLWVVPEWIQLMGARQVVDAAVGA